MGKVVYADESSLDYLRKLTCENPAAVGIIIGQSSTSRYYVVHLARTPEERNKPESQDSISPLTFNSIQEIPEPLITNHVKHVTRMLPGGFCVLGMFICCKSDVFNESLLKQIIKKIFTSVKKVVTSEHLPHADNEKLILHYNPVDQKYNCQVLDVNNSILSTFKPVDWKFQNNSTKWCQIYSKFDMNWPSIGGKTSTQLRIQLKNFLQEVTKLLDPAVIAFGGKVQNSQNTLETITKSGADRKKCGSELQLLEASVFTPLQGLTIEDEIIVTDCDVELNLMGVLRSQVFVSSKATFEETALAVKEDILRSLTARMEIHWDSLVGEDYDSPEEKETIHEPPHRVSISLPNSEICFNDYIFPGESANEVITTCRELLDIDITEENVNVEYEMHGVFSDLYGKPAVSTSTSSDDILSSTLPTGFLIAAISFAVILIGIAIALQFQKAASHEKAA